MQHRSIAFPIWSLNLVTSRKLLFLQYSSIISPPHKAVASKTSVCRLSVYLVRASKSKIVKKIRSLSRSTALPICDGRHASLTRLDTLVYKTCVTSWYQIDGSRVVLYDLVWPCPVTITCLIGYTRYFFSHLHDCSSQSFCKLITATHLWVVTSWWYC